MKILNKIIMVLLLLFISVSTGWAESAVLPANSILASNGTWNNLSNSYADDALYASGIGSPTGKYYFRAGLENITDTINRTITQVVIYTKGYSSYSKSRMLLQPYWGDSAGLTSGTIRVGTTEVLNSFNITSQKAAWTWQDINNLNIKFIPKTYATYYVNYIFAVVTYIDTSTVSGNHHFEFAFIASPETLGVAFPVSIVAKDDLGDTVYTYNGTVSVKELTGTITPISATFTSGVCNFNPVINDVMADNAIEISDGDTFAVSNGFEVIDAGLHHFSFEPITTPQTVDVPFVISIIASNFFGDTVTTFTGKVDLWDNTGTITPDSSGAFASGVWSGNVTIGTENAADSIYCSYFSTKSFAGYSNGFEIQTPSGVAGDGTGNSAIKAFSLKIVPNPVSDKAEIALNLPDAGKTTAILYNIVGQEVIRRDFGYLSSGNSNFSWNLGRNIPQGLYFMRVIINGKQAGFKKLVILN